MKYLMLIYTNPANMALLAPEELNGMMQEADTLMQELTASGEMIGGLPLEEAFKAKTIKVRNGETIVTDGPFIESKEQFVGYCLLECESYERACAIAARWPDARYCAIELRPVLDVATE